MSLREQRWYYMYEETLSAVEEDVSSPTAEAWSWAEAYLSRSDGNDGNDQEPMELPQNWRSDVWRLVMQKALRRQEEQKQNRGTVLEAGNHLSYEDWMSGHHGHRMMSNVFFQPKTEYPLDCAMGRTESSRRTPEQRLSGPFYWGPKLGTYEVRLQDYLHKSGLQVFVKISGLELTPERPEIDGAKWTVPGFLNEHIVATALVAVDMENVSDCFVELRQETTKPEPTYDCCQFYGHDIDYDFHPSFYSEDDKYGMPAQMIGKVALQPGRLLAFPNIMEYRFSRCQLLDPARSGHVRFVSLYLVDPNYRICSTRNVPAQQPEWFAEKIREILWAKGLPIELCDQVLSYCADWPMGHDEAMQHKEQMQAELELVDMARIDEMQDS